MQNDPIIAALVELHRGLARQGPGDRDFSYAILRSLPPFPTTPRIADLGCGAGAATLLLADWFATEVVAVDAAEPFLRQLEADAMALGLRKRVRTELADMGSLDWPPASVDLLWSEGAAYNLTFEGALKAWRPLLAERGIAVISELCWFGEAEIEARRFWRDAYPAMGGEQQNRARAEAAGFQVLELRRLPSEAWWRNYYNPLGARIDRLRPTASAAMRSVIAETEQEMALFRRCSDRYGYTFFVLRAV